MHISIKNWVYDHKGEGVKLLRQRLRQQPIAAQGNPPTNKLGAQILHP